MTAIFAANGHLGTAAGFEAGFRPALAVAAGLSALGAIRALAVRARRHLPVAALPEASAAGALDN